MELPRLTMASDARPEWAGAGGHRARAHKDRVRHTEKQAWEATLESLIRLCLHTERLGEEEVTRIIDKFAEKPRNVEL
ncbi:hypothetical protein DPMN_006087 [Dreissena polymorpha]|uniref:Uncharacterized protein n=1 Tax=Dreissena polymorpha TaxID=45954 RepID=A0A9D4MTD5_DREPO|nr:hypothetical protein DPMN_006087 [Dreissena polymorpha]